MQALSAAVRRSARCAPALTRLFAASAIREVDAKKILAKAFGRAPCVAAIEKETDLDKLASEHPWLLESRLTVKLDQLVKRRGKGGWIKLNATWPEVKEWLSSRRNRVHEVQGVKAELTNFIVEKFVPHDKKTEAYVAMRATRKGDEILFHHQGGVDVGDVDSKASRLLVPTGETPSPQAMAELVSKMPAEQQAQVIEFLSRLFSTYVNLHFTYMEINPLCITADGVVPLDCAAKLDGDAEFFVGKQWGGVSFPPAFGRALYPEESYVKALDATTGASLKLTVLNPKGRIWTLVAGGGASVLYADTVADLGFGQELGNYGEYSGDPSESLTFEYCKTVFKLMTAHKHEQGKVLLIGGGVANFTDVAATFKGIVRAFEVYKDKIKEHNVKIFVRRGGPNWQEGLMMMKNMGDRLGLDLKVYGPDTYLTSIIPLALGKEVSKENLGSENFGSVKGLAMGTGKPVPIDMSKVVDRPYDLFSPKTVAVVYGAQRNAAQHMLNFDYLCGRPPSVACLIAPQGDNEQAKFFYGQKEVLIPIFQKLDEAMKKFPNINTCVNFASQRSVLASCTELLEYPQIKSISVIAEGVPERHTRKLIDMAKAKGVSIIGPATVGGIKPGSFRIGNSAGSLDNLISSKLYRPGSVAYVSKSGGLSNELNNIVSRYSDGVYEGIAIGGDKYPGGTFLDHLLRYEANPDVKMMVVLGELGGTLEYEVIEAKKKGLLTKPIVAYVMGTIAKMFPYNVQFGHAGAQAGGQGESADDKNRALRAAGIIVPDTFEGFGVAIATEFRKLVAAGIAVPKPEPEVPAIPVDYKWASKLGLVRKDTNFICTISDDRGAECTYHGIPISKVVDSDLGVGGTLGLLWFKKRLPAYAAKFIDMVLMTVADHGPAVSGAHNCIVTARAGKDLISSLVSGLMTIGPRFGGAIDGAATYFSYAVDNKLTPEQFIKYMAKLKKPIPGIGHRIKSLRNPDMRCETVKNYVFKHFPKHDVLDFALKVQDVTTKKKDTLILNVDGMIGCCFVDLLRNCGEFTNQEVTDYVESGALNGLFVVGRSMGFIGHYLDQKRNKQPLYRHPQEDIFYSS